MRQRPTPGRQGALRPMADAHGSWRRCVATGSPAPCVIDRPINGASFLAHVQQLLLPVLAPGDIVVMDNLGSHQGRAVRAAIRAAKAKLFFPPASSPDLNPTEPAFAKMNTGLAQGRRPNHRRDLANHRRLARWRHAKT